MKLYYGLLSCFSYFSEIWLTIISLVILGVASALCVIPTYDLYLDVLE